MCLFVTVIALCQDITKKIEDKCSNPSSINSNSAVSDRYNGRQSDKTRLTSFARDDDVDQGGRSCAGARVAPAEKFGLGQKF